MEKGRFVDPQITELSGGRNPIKGPIVIPPYRKVQGAGVLEEWDPGRDSRHVAVSPDLQEFGT